MTLWEIDIYPSADERDAAADSLIAAAADLGLASDLHVATARGFLIQAEFNREYVELLSDQLLCDTVVETAKIDEAGADSLSQAPKAELSQQVYVLPKPGVMDPVAQSTTTAIADFGQSVAAVRTFRKYWLPELPQAQFEKLCNKLLANDAIEQVIVGPIPFEKLSFGKPYEFALQTTPIRKLDDAGLTKLSKEGQLYLTLVEMQTIQKYFVELGRDPTDIELESVAQTWSEHCSHKTLAGRIAYEDEKGKRSFNNMLKETIFAATQEIRESLGDKDWCVSVFQDNAGIVRFDEEHNVVFKVETHNHPSALEPYGGANTGIGGVVRDPMGTGMGAKPICNTDVFCFAPPDVDPESLPQGVLHPRRVMNGVVSGVRDYGNRMGIPTVNGAVYFDERYLGNPLVYCGNVGLIPQQHSFKEPKANDLIVALGGRTGRDGIHGATFSSAELTSESESLSGGAVQIGNAITEKMVLDVLLEARDRGLFNAVTDCGAGGFSSAVGEMGEMIGADVWLDRAPLKYDGLSYTEIWISEAQERMILAVPDDKWDELEELCSSEGVEATIIGRYVPTGRLKLFYYNEQVGDLDMKFLHDGRPPIIREATYKPLPVKEVKLPVAKSCDFAADLKSILGSLNVASKHWIIRQYDHEVQGGSAIKPLVGVMNDGPGDAAVVRPVLTSNRGVVVSCGMNPRYGDFDTYDMATSAIDEAMRNCVAVGADPSQIAILDNFCWGYTDRPETLGSLVRSAIACYDMAIALGTPFISGKDSLNNEFSYFNDQGEKQTISIPPSLLISALGQVDDVRRCVTMDLKKAGSKLYVVGKTFNELGGSHWALIHGQKEGAAPKVNPAVAKATFTSLHKAIHGGLVRACHDLSEGGLAVALAEMAFAGGLGAEVSLDAMPHDVAAKHAVSLLFSESNTRFLVEVPAENEKQFQSLLAGVPHAAIGTVVEAPTVTITHDKTTLVSAELDELKQAWLSPLDW
ncbi:phosphoribosylformylglycinamidine synthase subunit PurL [Blastopirellula retiformator]|uniref:Phosphoribosylformylglycinamidine synthase subunit PurL n=1 Tax=Blastopirellula retiformator TaxID=2527970 RepID=A0A5C5UZ63_9BACT|nr:phosphoribosylformylglycinamidine synthase subunit PurL [Blastopirellula retiformator]TWT30910.1 Phosphoribosylformylglycinamidine synthase subunit PurL [Blastopirellula retiformator]